jgi:hypothetical protein
MSIAAIWLMIIVQLSFTLITAYLFIRVLNAPEKKKPDPEHLENS